MQRPSDETSDRLSRRRVGREPSAAEIAQALEHDPDALRARAQRLGDSTRLLRAAYDAVLREPVPERLIAAARGKTPKARRSIAVAQLGRGAT